MAADLAQLADDILVNTRNADVFHRVITPLINLINRGWRSNGTEFTYNNGRLSGSFPFDMKINLPNEFDYNFQIHASTVFRVERPERAGEVRVFRGPWLNELVPWSTVRDDFRAVLSVVCQSYNDDGRRRWEVAHRQNGPAVRVTLSSPGEQEINVDVVPTVPCMLTRPINLLGEDVWTACLVPIGPYDRDDDSLWRVSVSEEVKRRLHDLDLWDHGYRTACVRLIKLRRDQSRLSKLKSYHIVLAVFKMCQDGRRSQQKPFILLRLRDICDLICAAAVSGQLEDPTGFNCFHKLTWDQRINIQEKVDAWFR